jgi:cytochrome c oxidase subunit 2
MDDQSTLHPASHAADKIADLWWILFAVSMVVFTVVVALLLVGALRGRGGGEPDRSNRPGARIFVAVAGIVVPLVVVVALFFASVATLPAVAPAGKNPSLTIEVVGRQWFWDVYYRGGAVRTSNEIHVPVGEPVEIRVRSADVNHSLWVPRLNRKIDLIPGHTNSIIVEAQKPGVYRGQCAEFCGVQHGNMAFLVIADTPGEFQRWLAHEARPSRPAAGTSLFVASGCGGCHRIAGTRAEARYGPDLTHFAARRTIGAGTLPNTRDDLAAWLRDPQAVKPGNKMPDLALSDADIEKLVAYLESLK